MNLTENAISSKDLKGVLSSISNQLVTGDSTRWYLNAKDAKFLDDDLMSKSQPDSCNFSVYQLMELAGLGVAQSVYNWVSFYTKDGFAIKNGLK